MMIIVAVLAILAAIVFPIYQGKTEEARFAAAALTIKTIQLKVKEHYASEGQWPATIDPAWFQGGAMPENPFREGSTAIFSEDNPGKVEMFVKDDQSYNITYWYNQNNGYFHTRVPYQGSPEATLELYNRVNHTDAANVSY